MIKVMTVFGTRPEAIKMAPVIRALNARPDVFECVVTVTGQHREMLDQVLKLFEIEPHHDLRVMTANQTLASMTSRVLERLDPILEQEAPDWVLVQGDTTTAMTASLGAFYRQIKVGHIEAGLRTHDKHQPFPEEINRRITSVMADLHFAPTEWAANNLRKEGHPDDRIVVTGNTVIDAIQTVAQMPFEPDGQFPAGLLTTDKRIILVTAHRRENFGEGIIQICAALRTLAEERDDIHIVYPVHLNPNIREPVYRELGNVPNITLLPPLDYQPLVWLMKQSYLIISDSGGIQEEAPGLGKPVLVLRETTERPEGVEAGTVTLVGANTERILGHASQLLDDQGSYAMMARADNPYGDGTSANLIVARLDRS
jgi:UDP-N-acetylglucosamine 2-epimerase (non-hydrolysing)